MIRVYLLDDHEVVRYGLREMLEREGDIEVIGESGSAVDAAHRIPALRPDVAAQYHALEQSNVARGRAAAAAGAQNAMTGRTFQDRRTMTHIIEAARNHPIVKKLGLWVP